MSTMQGGVLHVSIPRLVIFCVRNLSIFLSVSQNIDLDDINQTTWILLKKKRRKERSERKVFKGQKLLLLAMWKAWWTASSCRYKLLQNNESSFIFAQLNTVAPVGLTGQFFRQIINALVTGLQPKLVDYREKYAQHVPVSTRWRWSSIQQNLVLPSSTSLLSDIFISACVGGGGRLSSTQPGQDAEPVLQ